MEEYKIKVPGGKLLRIKIDICSKKMKSLQILGDFFLYPEDKIKILEESLVGKTKEGVYDQIKDTINTEKIQLLGFGANDLNNLILRAFEDEMETNN